MAQKRNRQARVEDRWKRADGLPTARAGSGKGWMVRFVDDHGRKNTKSFDKQKAAQAWLNEITGGWRVIRALTLRHLTASTAHAAIYPTNRSSYLLVRSARMAPW